MPKLKREQIEKLAGASDSDKADLLALFQECEDANANVEKLRASAPKDSQMVVEKAEHSKLTAALQERDQKISTLEAQLAKFNIDASGDDWMGFFKPIFNLFEGDSK